MESLGIVTINGVPSKDAELVWPMVECWVQSACNVAPDLITPRHILQQIKEQDQQLWVVNLASWPVAAMTTRIAIHPTGARVLEVVTLGGTLMKRWLPDVVALLKQFAAEHGCIAVEAHGRRGWVKALKEFGWDERSVTVAMEISNG